MNRKPLVIDTPPEHRDDEGTVPVSLHRVGSWRISVHRQVFTPSELVRRYDRAARRWDTLLDWLGYGEACETLLQSVLDEMESEFAGGRPRVLDCGVGTGAFSGALARVLPGRFSLDAIDLSPRMLERAGNRLGDAGVAVRLHRGDVRELPFPDGVMDIVLAGHVLEHLADPGTALDEIARVLRPDGLLIACLTRHSALGLLVQGRWRTQRVTPDQAEAWLRRSGLERVRSLTFGEHSPCRWLSVACTGRKPRALGRTPRRMHDVAIADNGAPS